MTVPLLRLPQHWPPSYSSCHTPEVLPAGASFHVSICMILRGTSPSPLSARHLLRPSHPDQPQTSLQALCPHLPAGFSCHITIVTWFCLLPTPPPPLQYDYMRSKAVYILSTAASSPEAWGIACCVLNTRYMSIQPENYEGKAERLNGKSLQKNLEGFNLPTRVDKKKIPMGICSKVTLQYKSNSLYKNCQYLSP